MADPGADLQNAVIAALLADSAVSALVSDRVYDIRSTSPEMARFPYLAVGDADVVYQHADGWDGANSSFVVHAWSRENGFWEVKSLGQAVELALNRAALTIPGHRIAGTLLAENSHYMRDPDGVSAHGAIRFSLLTEPSS